ncbi:EamA family transporter [Treponema parvum]|uniref:EamA family transporter n=1 Tax=Treponema parvum TaxID=138851 RepID=A0A975EYJ3_9SPIR|nr:EamA family transporter [Treponema parvum]QTQ11181.1 EamA family transporter [Treponema parvum]
MVYLLLAICVNLILVFTFKVAHACRWNAKHIVLVNYIFAFLVTLTSVIKNKTIFDFFRIGKINFHAIFHEQSINSTMFIVVVSGILIGIFYVVNILLMDASIPVNGAGMTTLFSRSGFLLTITFSVFLFAEKLTLLRSLGIGFTLAALIIASGIGTKTAHAGNLFILFSMTFVAGSIEMLNKSFSVFTLPGYTLSLMFVVFCVTLILYSCLYVSWSRSDVKFRVWKWQEIAVGIFMGLPNAFGNIFQILALKNLPTSIVYPSIAAGNLLVSILLSRCIFREELNTGKIIAVILTMAGMISVNLNIR